MRFELGKKQKSEGNPRRYKLELSVVGWIATVAVLLIGVTWVFIFGVLVGRGYRPEQTVPELARIMPSDNRTNASAGTDDEVLKAEELQFYDSLKEDGQESLAGRTPVQTPEKSAATKQPAQESAPKTQAPKKQATADKAPKQQPTAEKAPKQQAAAPAQKPEDLLVPPEPAPTDETVAAATPETPASAKPAEPTEPRPAADDAGEEGDQQVYDYVYQVAAFADPSSAESFRSQVVGLGFKADVVASQGDGKTWHRVMVHFQGRPEDTRQLKSRLAEIGVERTILRDKKPI